MTIRVGGGEQNFRPHAPILVVVVVVLLVFVVVVVSVVVVVVVVYYLLYKAQYYRDDRALRRGYEFFSLNFPYISVYFSSAVPAVLFCTSPE